MKRKAIRMILTAAMVSGMLAGCGSKTTGPEVTEASGSEAVTEAAEETGIGRDRGSFPGRGQ